MKPHRLLLSLLPTLCFVVICLPSWSAQPPLGLKAGELELSLAASGDGLSVKSLADTSKTRELLAGPARPLFTVVLHNVASKSETTLHADAGWKQVSTRARSRMLELNWTTPTNAGMEGISVTVTASAEKSASAIHWKLRVNNSNPQWSVWRVSFPDIGLAEPGANPALFFPRGPGEVQMGAWNRPFEYHGSYPDGWCAMQFAAAYAAGGAGLYVGLHDPFGSTKTMEIKSDPQLRFLRVAFEHPAPDLGIAGNSFTLPGEAVWQLLRGDWFDAAMVYKSWARKEAKWWPRLGHDGRDDTPRWMRELSAWAMTGGAPGDCVQKVEALRSFLGLPLGFHWYNWHEIPFDNDYPHYFPPKPGFAGGVSKLKAAGVFPMPYINGRLWDSKDRGGEDFEFRRLALPGVTKKADGAAELESYGSKETNGEPVRLGVMCPSTSVWRNTVSNTVLRLLKECGTSAVYIDQIAAAAPKLCMDRSHGHPLGGGHWWTESYWQMLQDIRRAMPPGTVLTTECNAEPFIHCFDGYLTWHWQHDGQVPAFPAVYGGTIEMFGRAYRGGATKDLALRMKAGQQLVFGEQLGWLDPSLVNEKENAEFFRQLAQIRFKFSRYFYAGEMVRPPGFTADIPKVKADWQWSGEWWVSTDAVLTGSWRLPKEHRMLLMFVNVSDEPVSATVRDDSLSWGMKKERAGCEITFGKATPPNGGSGVRSNSKVLETTTTFGPGEVQAWEFKW